MLIQLKHAIVAIVLSIVVIGGISIGKYNSLLRRYQAAQSANAQLQRDVEDLKYGADRLLAQARSSMEKRDYVQVIVTADQLLQRHPESPEATTVKHLKGQANEFLTQQRIVKEKAARAEQERIAREERARVAAEKARVAQALRNMRTSYDKVDPLSRPLSHKNKIVFLPH